MHRETTRTLTQSTTPGGKTDRIVQDPDKVTAIEDHAPWEVTDLSLRPFDGMWSFNPSIHFDGEVWRCVLRCADYAMPDGNVVRSDRATPAHSLTKNALAILDPKTWKPTNVFPMRENDRFPRKRPCPHLGFEDLRLFTTTENGLQAIACSLQLAGERPSKGPEQVVLTLDDHYNIISALPIRGSWSNSPQKNWAPFDRAPEARFLYSIERGIVFDPHGPIIGWPTATEALKPHPRPHSHGGPEVTMRRRSVALSSGSTGGKPGYGGLRGGSQLIQISNDRWLGIGHDMRYVRGKKFYWHDLYTLDNEAHLIARSAPIKLAPEGIEFAAGMALDGHRLVISYGVDDMHCRIGVTDLDAVLEMLRPIGDHTIVDDELVGANGDDDPAIDEAAETLSNNLLIRRTVQSIKATAGQISAKSLELAVAVDGGDLRVQFDTYQRETSERLATIETRLDMIATMLADNVAAKGTP